MKDFSVSYRNYGHWDIYSHTTRMFRIRGGPGKYVVLDERGLEGKNANLDFNTVAACMSYICDELMYELIVAEGQGAKIIESWNVD